MASANSKFDEFFFCSVFNLNDKNVNALIAHKLSEFTCTRSLTMNSKFSTEISRSLLVSDLAQVNPDNSLVAGADPGFFLGGGAPLRRDVTDR